MCAVIPDIDAIGRPFYGAAGDLEWLGGHRGFTHSLTFAALLGLLAPLATIGRARWDWHGFLATSAGASGARNGPKADAATVPSE